MPKIGYNVGSSVRRQMTEVRRHRSKNHSVASPQAGRPPFRVKRYCLKAAKLTQCLSLRRQGTNSQ